MKTELNYIYNQCKHLMVSVNGSKKDNKYNTSGGKIYKYFKSLSLFPIADYVCTAVVCLQDRN